MTDWEGELVSNSGAGNFDISLKGPRPGATFTIEVTIAEACQGIKSTAPAAFPTEDK